MCRAQYIYQCSKGNSKNLKWSYACRGNNYTKRVVPKTKSNDVVHHDNQWQQTYMQQKEETSAGY